MTFKSLKGKINILEIVRQRIPGCGTADRRRQTPVPYVDRLTRGSPVHHDQLNVGDGDQECWTQVGRVPTRIQVPCCVALVHMDTHSEPSPVDDVQPVKFALPEHWKQEV